MRSEFAAFIPLMGCICNILLPIFVITRGARITVNRIYFFLGFAIAIWNLGQFYLFRVHDPRAALLWARILWFGVIFIPALLFHISLSIAQVPIKRYIWYIYGALGILAATDFTNFFISGVRLIPASGWYAIPGPGIFVAQLSFALMFVAICILIRKRRLLPRMHRTRLDPLIFSQALLAVLGTNDILPIVGVDYYPFTKIPVYPYGGLAAVSYGIIIAYSVLQHQLLDVQVTLSRVVAHVVRLAFLFVIALGLMLTITVFFPGVFTRGSFFSALGVLVVSGTMASVYFPRLFGRGSETIEQRILGDRFEYYDQIRSFTAAMPLYGSAETLLADLHNLLAKVVCARSYQIILLDETNQVFSLFRSHPDLGDQQYPELQGSAAIFRSMEAGKEYIALNPAYSVSKEGKAEKEARAQLGQFNAEFCFPFFFQEEPFGLLLLGPKTTGDPYTATDIELLVMLAKNLSLMINQARLRDQVMVAQELELLGRMSRGMAHDLNNLLTPLWTLLQLAGEGIPLEALKDELLPLAMRNIETMRAYIKDALFFSKNLRPNIQLGRLDVVVRQSIDMVREQLRRKKIEIAVKTATDISVEMDEVLIKRLLINLLSNAMDASPEGAELRVEAGRLAKTPAKRDWVRITIIDRGDGIPEENLNRIFTPYYTTKDRGDENRGFGLGLSICRKIVHLHGGNLNLASKVKKGTTVNVDLPTRQAVTPPSAAVEVAQ